jgi:hypothetical protein
MLASGTESQDKRSSVCDTVAPTKYAKRANDRPLARIVVRKVSEAQTNEGVSTN